MSLLQEIQHDAVDVNVPLAVLLRKCMVLGSNLQNEELTTWAGRELNGYRSADDPVPDYRRLPAAAYGAFTDGYSHWPKRMISAFSLPEKHREFARMVFLRHGVAELQALAANGPQGELTSPWPAELNVLVRNEIFKGAQLIEGWQEITHGEVVGVLDAIRNRVLEFAIALKRESPDAGEPMGTPVAAATVTHLVQTIINGNVTNLAVASPQAVQALTSIAPGNIDELRDTFVRLGVPEREIEAFESEAKDEKPVDGQLGPKASTWLGRMTAKVGRGSLELPKGVSVEMIVKAISAYFGLP